MKRSLYAFLMILSALAVQAQDADRATAKADPDMSLTFLRNDDLDRLSVWLQQEEYVRKSRGLSFVLPGTGQFMNGERLSGSLYLAGSAALRLTTLTVAYLLLPRDLKFGNLNLLTDRFSYIEETVKAHSAKDFLPSAAVLLSGSILHGVLGYYASGDAERLARKRIEEGDITFSPDPEHLFSRLLLPRH